MRAADADPGGLDDDVEVVGSSWSLVRKSVAPKSLDSAARSGWVPTTSSSAGRVRLQELDRDIPSVPVPTTATRSPGRAFAFSAAAAMQAAGSREGPPPSGRGPAARAAARGRVSVVAIAPGRVNPVSSYQPCTTSSRPRGSGRRPGSCGTPRRRPCVRRSTPGPRPRPPRRSPTSSWPGRERISDVPVGTVALVDLAVAATIPTACTRTRASPAPAPARARSAGARRRLDDDRGAHCDPWACAAPSRRPTGRNGPAAAGTRPPASTSSSTPRPGSWDSSK